MPETTTTKPETGWYGGLELVYANCEEKTKIIHSFHQAPLKLQSPFYPEGQTICHSIILHTAGGIVGGDRLNQKIQLQPNAHSLITTAAASKIYRSNGQIAQQTVTIEIEPGATLEYLPQENIIFSGAIYRQDLRIQLAPEATWIGWEINRFGRSARGEQFVAGEWRSYTEVWQNNRPLWIDRQWLPGEAELVNSINGLAGKSVVGTFSYLGKPVDKEILEKINNLKKTSENKGEFGVTELMSGLLCRYRGYSTAEARAWFSQVWQILRSELWQLPTIKPRVWQV